MDENKNAPENGREQNTESLSDLMKVMRSKLNTLKEAGKDPYVITKYDITFTSAEIVDRFDEICEPEHDHETGLPLSDKEPVPVSIAGRIILKRVMGKAAFAQIQDKVGMIQIYARLNELGDEKYAEFKTYDIGDIIGVKGTVFRTMKGEISVKCTEILLLSKALRPLPEKHHGLKDEDLRARMRYVDLIVNPEVKDVFVKRSRIISAIRRFLDGREFLEVETPVLHTIAGGAAARPFITHHNTLDIDMYLRIALELYLKRLIVGGMDRVYEIGRVFRNEGMDTRHNPEFTLLELYQAYTDFEGMMEITENLIRYCAHEVLGTGVVPYGDLTIDLDTPFARITMTDAVKKYAGVDFSKIGSLEEARALCDAHKIHYENRHGIGDILNLFFEEYCEKQFVQPTFVTHHPVDISPLAKKDPKDPRYTERFELFINGSEFANAFSELNDPIDQRQRFEHQAALKAAGDDEACDVDNDFLDALEYGMPPTGGMGMGVDRLCMLLTNTTSIREVLLFPTMKPLDARKADKPEDKAAGNAEEAPAAAPAIEGAPAISSEKPDFSNVAIEPLFTDLVDFETFSKSDFRAVKVKACEAVPKSKKLLKFTLDDGTGSDRIILSGIHAFYEPEELVGKTCVAIVNLPPRPMMGIESCGMLISAVHKEGEEEKLHLLQLDPHIPAGAKLY
jgi:lysyl-tRNA synthetase class 2